MSSSSETEKPKKSPLTPAGEFFRFLASLKLAVALLVALVMVLAAATFVESGRGREYAQWHIYHSVWFMGALALLCVNVVAAAILKFPWKGRHIGFLIAHVGLLLLLAGSLQTFLGGVEGQLTFAEGETADTIVIFDRSQLTTSWLEQGSTVSLDFPFAPGPVDWREGKTLDLGESDEVHAKVLAYFRHARRQTDWVEDPSGESPPALKFALFGTKGTQAAEHWILAHPLGGETMHGPARFALHELPAASMVDALLDPPTDNLGTRGQLSVYYKDQVKQIAVDEELPQKVVISDDGTEVEISQYIPNAGPITGDEVRSLGDEPLNPLVELSVRLPGGAEPLRQIALAKAPFEKLREPRGRQSPVHVLYHHPAVTAKTGAEFFQTPEGKLFCRTAAGGRFESQGEVKPGDQFEAFVGIEVRLLAHVSHAVREVSFQPVEPATGEKNPPEAAAHFEVTVAGETHQMWLTRGGGQMQAVQQIQTAKGPMLVTFGYESRPLDFSLRLVRFTRGRNPGGMGDASYASTVQLNDKTMGLALEQEISMNRPLTHGKFTFYQSSFDQTSDGRNVSRLTAAYDPGRILKYAGSLVVCIGTFVTFYLRGRSSGNGSPSGASKRGAKKTAAAILLLALPLAIGAPAYGAEQSAGGFEWGPWQHLPVQSDGRRKPLDTLARESLQDLTGGTSLTDPQSGRTLEAVEAYLTLLFRWGGWNPPAGSHATAAPTEYSDRLQADKWDRAPLFPVDHAELRQALGMSEDQKRISPAGLGQATLLDPDTEKPIFFDTWAQKLYFDEKENLTRFEEAVRKLANKLRSYQAHRAGQRLEIIPVEGSGDQRWISVAELMRSDYNDASDPTGGLGKAKKQFKIARDAFVINSPESFQKASDQFIATLVDLGPKLGDYPNPGTIELEVAYNRWKPFRFAWAFAVIASVCMLLSVVTRTGASYVAGLSALGACLAAMIVGLTLRSVITERAPVTNLYESVVFTGLGTVLFGLAFGVRSRRMGVLAAAAVVTTIILLLADFSPSVLDPSLRPLPPVLRSNFWLAVHVMTIMLSYAAFALAVGIGNVTLGFYLARSKSQETIEAQSRFTYKSLQAGVFLLLVGTFLGAAWADYSWGRFWGWDPKEVWALITLLGYLAILHAKAAGWIGYRGLAAWSVVCFTLVLMAWYGVNFLSGGLHNYGLAGKGGPVYVLSAIGLQLLYVAAALLRSGPRNGSPGKRSD